uniref:tumor necrosis factor receptor superfamily member 25-like n=1 Tax=Pristiophorus japonicus TaxID=55135 RepID=UPI00398E5B5E
MYPCVLGCHPRGGIIEWATPPCHGGREISVWAGFKTSFTETLRISSRLELELGTMRIANGTGRQSWLWIRIGLCAMISASATSNHLTAGDSWGLSREEWNMTRITGESRQLGIQKDGVRRRGKRSSEHCSDNLYQDTETLLCCKKCPAGFYVGSSCEHAGELPLCKPCPRGTYLAHENYVDTCLSCTMCDKVFQTVHQMCTATNNTVCGCHAYQYQHCHSANCQSFYCHNCSNCSNRKITTLCSKKIDTQCGECLSGFYQDGDQCKACTEEPCKNKSSPSCATCLKPDSPPISKGLTLVSVLAVVVSLIILLLMVQFLCQKIRHRRSQEELEAPTVTVPEEDKKTKNEDKSLPFEIPAPDGKSDAINDVPIRPLANGNIYGTSPQTALFQPETQAVSLQGRTLYEIINMVPVRRWKELMRLLELRDCDIERIEMDVAQSRDQQYEMLRQWSQQHTASVESVYQALEVMNLSGLVEELQTKLLNINALH